ncbi:MAG TPA: hypothetical protein VHN18_03090 [Micromonosporaceae bacterium]|nr:hypothetical protein [Micromonosporaceae bacterium]
MRSGRVALAAAPGPAVLLAGPFGGGDLPSGYESRNLALGRDGSYRLLSLRWSPSSLSAGAGSAMLGPCSARR